MSTMSVCSTGCDSNWKAEPCIPAMQAYHPRGAEAACTNASCDKVKMLADLAALVDAP